MKLSAILLILFFSSIGYSQYKDPGFPTENVKDGIINNSGNNLFDFLNSENFSMHHSYSMSYSSFGNNGVALGMYTNSMMYKFSQNLNVQLDASFVHSPYSSFGKEHQDALTGIYISKAALNFKPWDDVYISVQYRNLPGSYYYSPYYRPNGYGSFFDSTPNSDWMFR